MSLNYVIGLLLHFLSTRLRWQGLPFAALKTRVTNLLLVTLTSIASSDYTVHRSLDLLAQYTYLLGLVTLSQKTPRKWIS